MSNQRYSSYRGCSITTHWAEVSPPSDWIETDPLGQEPAKRFTSSFSVAANAACDESWQQFPTAEFESSAGALAGATTAARQMIDAKLAEISAQVRR